MALYMLEASIAWDKSIMKAVSLTTARNSVCAKLRNRCVSLKATNQYKQLLTTSQTSVGIRTNLLTKIVLCYSYSLNTFVPSRVWLAHRESVRRFERISTGVCSTRRPSLNDILLTRRCSYNTSASNVIKTSDVYYHVCEEQWQWNLHTSVEFRSVRAIPWHAHFIYLYVFTDAVDTIAIKRASIDKSCSTNSWKIRNVWDYTIHVYMCCK